MNNADNQTALDVNIENTKKQCQEIERQLAETALPVKQVIVLCKNFTEHMNALMLLHQIKEGRANSSLTGSKIIQRPGILSPV